MPKLQIKHSITVTNPLTGSGTISFYFYAPREAYEGITTETGVAIPGGNDKAQYDSCPACSVQELLSPGVAVRKVLLVERGAKKYRHKIIVANNKANTFNSDATNKFYRGGTVKKVINPLDAIFY